MMAVLVNKCNFLPLHIISYGTFLGGGGGFLFCEDFSSFCSFTPRLESFSGITTKKWLHFSHLTNLAATIKDIVYLIMHR